MSRMTNPISFCVQQKPCASILERLPARTSHSASVSPLAPGWAAAARTQLWFSALSMICGLSLGADVPFCLHRGLCRAQGIGEILTPFTAKKQYPLILIQPCRGLSTKQVFDELSKETSTQHPNIESAIRALQMGDLALLAASIGNTLQSVSEKLRPEIRQAINALREHGARIAQMTGSGSAVFGVFPTARAARTAWDSLSRRYPVCVQTQTISESAKAIQKSTASEWPLFQDTI